MNVLTEITERFDRQTAAGILARAAMSAQTGQEYRVPIVENEDNLRAALIEDARKRAGIRADDNSPEAIDKISSVLDAESDRISGTTNEQAAYGRLIERGDFPSDLYQIKIARGLIDVLGDNYERERKLIERTVRAPDREQHFKAHEEDQRAPSMISLFAREFRTPYSARNFTMLVVGQRGDGLKLHVHMAWRLYPSHVNAQGAHNLVELLERFADEYGVDVVLDGSRGRFFLSTVQKVPASVDISLPKSAKTKRVTITRFFQKRTVHGPDGRVMNEDISSLVMAIDLDRYRATLKSLDSKEVE